MSDTAPLTRRRALQLASSLVAVGSAALLAGCGAEQSAAAQARSGDRKGYVSGDGTTELIPVAARDAPVRLVGTTLEGQPWSNANLLQTVLVINVWGSWCPPCIGEAADLQKVWETVQRRKAPVRFLGLDKMETPPTGLAFQRQHRITYPSLAYDGGVLILALQGKAVATPTTLVLDTSARIAARISGPITASVLTGLIDDILAED